MIGEWNGTMVAAEGGGLVGLIETAIAWGFGEAFKMGQFHRVAADERGKPGECLAGGGDKRLFR